jgi:hypothetical protein
VLNYQVVVMYEGVEAWLYHSRKFKQYSLTVQTTLLFAARLAGECIIITYLSDISSLKAGIGKVTTMASLR